MRIGLVTFLLLCATLAAIIVAGCTQSPQTTTQATEQPTATATVTAMSTTAADTVKIGTTSLGNVLTDSKGLTLYYFITDVPGTGTSTCYSAANCSQYWPIFSPASVIVSPPLSASDFTTFTRTDGTMQAAYDGHPLYYFVKDANPGDVNGENVLHTWFVAKPDYAVMIASTPALGEFLTDADGRTLYVFVKDVLGGSTCTGACLTKWPAFSTSSFVVPSILKTSDFSMLTRSDGVRQVAYLGRPLYYYSGDTGPGMTTGSGFAGNWYVANITGFLPAATPTPTTVPITTAPTMNPYSSGY